MDNAFLTYVSDILADTNDGLTGTEIIKYCNSFAIKFNVVIPVDNVEMLKTTYIKPVPNKRVALKRNLEVFNLEQQIEIISFLSDLPKMKDKNEVKELLEKMQTRYKKNISIELNKNINETKHWLSDYPNSLKVYNEAIQKYEKGIYQRNVLDDMRLSLELLVKVLLNNGKTLENQISIIGAELKKRNTSKEITNLFDKLLLYYTNYQNEHIKHNDNVKPEEIELVISQTNSFMLFLIKLLG